MRDHRAGAALVAVLLAFRAVAASAQGAAEARLAFVGDTGTGDENQRRVRDQLLQWRPPQVFLLGDNIYESGARRDFGERFDAVYTPVMRAGSRFHSTLGNHDVKYCQAATGTRLPADGTAYAVSGLRCDVRAQLTHAGFGYLNGRRYYSVPSDASGSPVVEVFVLDSNTLRSSQSKLLPVQQDLAQLEWLDAALGASRARWKVVILHHPPHSPAVPVRYFFVVPIGGGRAREGRLDEELTPILRRHGVDVVFAGHNHFYARMAPQNGIRYFVSGGGGRRTYDHAREPGYVLAGGAFYHFVYVRATAEVFEYYTIDAAGAVRDAGFWRKGEAADRAFPRGTRPPLP